MPRDRRILHADLDAFYASVEQRDDPRLRNRPMLVGGGVVLSASYEARAAGVRTAMSGREARRLCPEVIEVPPRMKAYSEASAAVFEIFHDTSPQVEGLSIDEAFLDVTGLWRLRGDSTAIAARLRERVQREVGLPLSVGGGTTKFLAKVASAVCKPDGLLIVAPGTEREFLHPLPVRRLWGVGPKTAERLEREGLFLVADVARADPERLARWIGPGSAAHLKALADNADPRRVDTGRRRRSIGAQRSFPRAPLDRNESDAILVEVTDRICRRLRTGRRLARTVVLRIRFADFTAVTRSSTLVAPTNSTSVVLATARNLLDGIWPEIERLGLTKVGVSLTNLVRDRPEQLVLDFDGRSRSSIDVATDAIRDRFGSTSIMPTTLVGRRRPNMPLLPD